MSDGTAEQQAAVAERLEVLSTAEAAALLPPLAATLQQVDDAATEVWQALGCGHTEAIFQRAMEAELRLRGIACVGQSVLPVSYKGINVGHQLPDLLLLEPRLVVELKAVKRLQVPLGAPEYAQLSAYMRALQLGVGVLINFPQSLDAECCMVRVLTRCAEPKLRPLKRQAALHEPDAKRACLEL